VGQGVDQGILPTLFAATQDIPGGTFVGPSGFRQLRGYPGIVKSSKNGNNTELGHCCGSYQNRLTGARLDCGTNSTGAVNHAEPATVCGSAIDPVAPVPAQLRHPADQPRRAALRRVLRESAVVTAEIGKSSAVRCSDERPVGFGMRDVERGLLRNACIPRSFDLSHECWVNNPIPERLDERHVCLAERTAWLDVDGHLALVATFALIYPGQVHHAVTVWFDSSAANSTSVRYRGAKGRNVNFRSPGRVAQIVWQSVGQ